MFRENLIHLRKQKGMSQETLARQLHVVRQTVSKWEKGLSVPDADQLIRLAELFEISVSDLLGEKLPEAPVPGEVAVQLALLNEQLADRARRNRRIVRGVLIGLGAMVLLAVLALAAAIAAHTAYRAEHNSLTTTVMHCTLNGEEYLYTVTYDDQYRIIAAGGDSWIADHVQTEQYDDADVLMAQIESYFTHRGGAVELENELPASP